MPMLAVEDFSFPPCFQFPALFSCTLFLITAWQHQGQLHLELLMVCWWCCAAASLVAAGWLCLTSGPAVAENGDGCMDVMQAHRLLYACTVWTVAVL
jgi:hypothetical protein